MLDCSVSTSGQQQEYIELLHLPADVYYDVCWQSVVAVVDEAFMATILGKDVTM